MTVKVDIKNTPPDVKRRFVVARRDDYTAELWYFGAYDDKERAYDIAQELDNGIVLERVEE